MKLDQLLEDVKRSFHSRESFVEAGELEAWTLIHAAFEVCEKLTESTATLLHKELMQTFPDVNIHETNDAATLQLALKVAVLLRRDTILRQEEESRT